MLSAVRGCWSDWGAWSTCQNPTKCDNFNTTRTRSRTCNMPEPGLGFKKDCLGTSTESIPCFGNSSFSVIENSSGY